MAGRVVLIRVLIGADARDLNILKSQTALHEQPVVGCPKVKVMATCHTPFHAGTTISMDGVHRKISLGKGLDDLLAHLETIRANTRPYHGLHIRGTAPILSLHEGYSLLTDTRHRATPTCMDCCRHSADGVIEQNGHAVGCAHANSKIGQRGDEGIHIAEFLTRCGTVRNHPHIVRMSLMRLKNRIG